MVGKQGRSTNQAPDQRVDHSQVHYATDPATTLTASAGNRRLGQMGNRLFIQSPAHDVLAPIHSIPVEVLSIILSECWEGRNSFRVAHVCRRWRAVALITHKLWADALSEEKFDFDDSLPADQRYTLLHYVSTMFARSSPQSLELHCSHFPDNALLYALMAHASKVVSLDVTIFNTKELVTLYSALSSGFLFLEYLKIEFRPQPRREHADPHHTRRLWFELQYFEGLPPLPQAALPGLKTVSVPGTLLTHLARESLECIELRPVWNHDSGPNVTRVQGSWKLCEALTKCPCLRSLEVIEALPEDIGLFPLIPPVVLPALETLTIRDFTESTAGLLSVLVVPSLSLLQIEGSSNIGFAQELVPGTRGGDVLQDLIRNADTVRIWDHTTKYGTSDITTQTFSGSSERLCIDYHHGFAKGSDYRALFRPFAPSITHLSLELAVDDRMEEQDAFFRAFPHLVSLRVAHPKTNQLLAALCAPDDPGNARSLVCPALRRLEVAFEFGMGSEVKAALEQGGKPDILAAHLRTRLPALVEMLAHRASRSSRLETLVWSEFEADMRTARMRGRAAQLPLGDNGHGDDFGVETLQDYVDGTATFSTFTFIPRRASMWDPW